MFDCTSKHEGPLAIPADSCDASGCVKANETALQLVS